MYREPTDPPLELSADDIPRRPKTALILGSFVLLAALVGGGLFVADKRDRARKQEVVKTAFAKLSTCLVGDPTDKPSVRLRQIQVAIAEDDPRAGKEPATELWPYRCHAHAQALLHVINTERLPEPDLSSNLTKLSEKLVGGDHEHRLQDLGEIADAIWARGLVATRVADVRAAPEPAKALLTLGDLKKVKPLTTKALSPSAIKTEVQSHRDLAFAVADPGVSLVCGGSDRIVCRKLPAEAVAVGGDPLLHAARDPGAVPVVVYGAAANVGAWTSDSGVPVIRGEKFGWAYRKKDGSTVTLSYRNEYNRKFRLTIDGKEPGTMIAPPGKVNNENLYYATALVPGFILWRGANEQDEIRIFAQSIEGTTAGPVQEIGEIGGWYAQGTDPQFKSCKTEEALVVAVKDKFTWHAAIHRNGSWTVPAKIDAFDRVTCRKAEATFTSTPDKMGGYVNQWKCANGICDFATAKLPAFGPRKAIATDAGIVTVSRAFDRGGVHLRVAPIDKLATQKSVVLFDDYESKDSWLRGFELLPLGSGAALVVTTTEGVYLVRIDGDKVTPLDVDAQ